MNYKQESLLQWATMALVFIAVMLFWLTMVLAEIMETLVLMLEKMP